MNKFEFWVRKVLDDFIYDNNNIEFSNPNKNLEYAANLDRLRDEYLLDFNIDKLLNYLNEARSYDTWLAILYSNIVKYIDNNIDNNTSMEILKLNIRDTYEDWISQAEILKRGSIAWRLNEKRAKNVSFVLFTYDSEIKWICYIPNPNKNWEKKWDRMIFNNWVMLEDLLKSQRNPVWYLQITDFDDLENS